MSNREREVILLSNYRYPNIEAERVSLNLSQEKLVNELGIERKTYYNWLRKGKLQQSIFIIIYIVKPAGYMKLEKVK